MNRCLHYIRLCQLSHPNCLFVVYGDTKNVDIGRWFLPAKGRPKEVPLARYDFSGHVFNHIPTPAPWQLTRTARIRKPAGVYGGFSKEQRSGSGE